MMNANNLIKSLNYVQNVVGDSEWDFATLFDTFSQRGCFVGHTPGAHGLSEFKAPAYHCKFLASAKCRDYSEFFGITPRELTWLFPETIDGTDNSYHCDLAMVSKERVCKRVMKLISWKFQREHKWKQWEYRHFGERTTEKRGVTV